MFSNPDPHKDTAKLQAVDLFEKGDMLAFVRGEMGTAGFFGKSMGQVAITISSRTSAMSSGDGHHPFQILTAKPSLHPGFGSGRPRDVIHVANSRVFSSFRF